MQIKKKKCKGTGKAIDSGCGVIAYLHKYGLCRECFGIWLYKTEAGKEMLSKSLKSAEKKMITENKRKHRVEKNDVKRLSQIKAELQKEINTIVRLIDIDKGCISCEHGWGSNWRRQAHAGHRLSVGSYPSIRFHLNNIKKQCSICNGWKSSNERNYDIGLIKYYGQDYLDFVKSLPIKYPELKMIKSDVDEKIIIARRIIREIKKGKDYTRDEVNEILGIYKTVDKTIKL